MIVGMNLRERYTQTVTCWPWLHRLLLDRLASQQPEAYSESLIESIAKAFPNTKDAFGQKKLQDPLLRAALLLATSEGYLRYPKGHRTPRLERLMRHCRGQFEDGKPLSRYREALVVEARKAVAKPEVREKLQIVLEGQGSRYGHQDEDLVHLALEKTLQVLSSKTFTPDWKTARWNEAIRLASSGNFAGLVRYVVLRHIEHGRSDALNQPGLATIDPWEGEDIEPPRSVRQVRSPNMDQEKFEARLLKQQVLSRTERPMLRQFMADPEVRSALLDSLNVVEQRQVLQELLDELPAAQREAVGIHLEAQKSSRTVADVARERGRDPNLVRNNFAALRKAMARSCSPTEFYDVATRGPSF